MLTDSNLRRLERDHQRRAFPSKGMKHQAALRFLKIKTQVYILSSTQGSNLGPLVQSILKLLCYRSRNIMSHIISVSYIVSVRPGIFDSLQAPQPAAAQVGPAPLLHVVVPAVLVVVHGALGPAPAPGPVLVAVAVVVF